MSYFYLKDLCFWFPYLPQALPHYSASRRSVVKTFHISSSLENFTTRVFECVHSILYCFVVQIVTCSVVPCIMNIPDLLRFHTGEWINAGIEKQSCQILIYLLCLSCLIYLAKVFFGCWLPWSPIRHEVLSASLFKTILGQYWLSICS